MWEFLESNNGLLRKKDLIFTDEDFDSDSRIKATKFYVQVKQIDSGYTQGTHVLLETQEIESWYAFEGSYSFNTEYLDYELVRALDRDILNSLAMSIAATLVVVLVITASFTATVLVALSILIVQFWVVGSVFYWNLAINYLVLMQVIFAIGLSVDYSSHIAEAYLVAVVPKRVKSTAAKRKYKASMALSSMGSSIFHGSFSTLLAIAVLATCESFIFTVFFRMWFGIILCSMANGFLFLPVVLSLIGPVEKHKKKKKETVTTEEILATE